MPWLILSVTLGRILMVGIATTPVRSCPVSWRTNQSAAVPKLPSNLSLSTVSICTPYRIAWLCPTAAYGKRIVDSFGTILLALLQYLGKRRGQRKTRLFLDTGVKLFKLLIFCRHKQNRATGLVALSNLTAVCFLG
jgi:hypothetical protein